MIIIIGHACQDSLQLKNDCICPGYTRAIFECSITGSMFGATIWRGSALPDCSSNEIILLHGNYFSQPDAINCNSEIIEAQGVRIHDNCFTSQLIIDITPDMIGKTVECNYDDATGNETTIGLLTIAQSISGKLVASYNIRQWLEVR